MEDLCFPELIIIIKSVPYAEVEAWNRTRNMMLYMISPYMKRKMTANELLPLIIDEDYEKEELTKEMPNEEVEWYKNFVKSYKKEGK